MVYLPSLLYPWKLKYASCPRLQHIIEPIPTELNRRRRH